jgi:DNA phosphorothioation-dependent restriction protein DptG
VHVGRLEIGRRGWVGLAAGNPIRRRKRHAPEARRGLCEFHGNRRRPGQILIHRDHTALFLLSAGCVLQEQSLPGSNHALQSHQRTVRTDHQRLRALIKLRAFALGSVDNNGNAQINPLAASAFQP